MCYCFKVARTELNEVQQSKHFISYFIWLRNMREIPLSADLMARQKIRKELNIKYLQFGAERDSIWGQEFLVNILRGNSFGKVCHCIRFNSETWASTTGTKTQILILRDNQSKINYVDKRRAYLTPLTANVEVFITDVRSLLQKVSSWSGVSPPAHGHGPE